MVACPMSYQYVSRSSRSSETGMTRAIVAAEVPTCAAYRQIFESS